MRTLLILVMATLLAGCSAPPPGEKPPRVVMVRTVKDAAGAPVLNVYTGEVRARHEADLAFRIGGKFIERRVDVGGRVQRGEILARLDPSDTLLASRSAAAQVVVAEADAGLARAELARTESLHARNFVSAAALDSRRAVLQAAEARLRQARAQAAGMGNQAQYATLLADYDGVVTGAPAEVGQVVAAGQTVLRVARPEEREVLIHLPESRLAGMQIGAPATVRAWAQPARDLAARVREISPVADTATRSYAVRVSVIAEGAELPLGATANVVFAVPATSQVLLPLTAVTRVDGRTSVWTVDADSQLRPLEVQVGEFREDGVAIRAGLPAGARVVLTGVHRLVAGETVRAVDESAPVALDVRQ